MYCYDSIWINGQRRGQIEHGIEKKNSEKSLSDCISNLSIACEICNSKYKKHGEKSRRLAQNILKNWKKGPVVSLTVKEFVRNLESFAIYILEMEKF